MKERSYRRWLLQSFLLAGVVPLLICVVLILGLFQTSVERYAAGVGQRRLEAMEHGLGSFAQLCEETLQHVAEDPTVARTVQEGTERDTAVYALLYQAVNTLTPEAGLSLYDVTNPKAPVFASLLTADDDGNTFLNAVVAVCTDGHRVYALDVRDGLFVIDLDGLD